MFADFSHFHEAKNCCGFIEIPQGCKQAINQLKASHFKDFLDQNTKGSCDSCNFPVFTCVRPRCIIVAVKWKERERVMKNAPTTSSQSTGDRGDRSAKIFFLQILLKNCWQLHEEWLILQAEDEILASAMCIVLCVVSLAGLSLRRTKIELYKIILVFW